MRYPLILSLLLLAGCSGSPTAPTPPPVAVATFDPNALRWDLAAPGCTIAKPVPMLNDRQPDIRTDSATSIRGLWLMSTSGRRSTYTEGVFQRVGNVWALCSWDTLVRESIS